MSGISDLIHHFKEENVGLSVLNKWRMWAYRILRRRKFPLDLSICAYGKHHLVDRIKPFGGGYIFWSKACDGCQMGKHLVELNKKKKIVPEYVHCAFLESGLLTRDQVKPGDIYLLPSIKD